MAESLYRRNPMDKSFGAVISNRMGMMRDTQHVSGKSIQSRNPAYIILTGKCNACIGGGDSRQVPIDVDKLDEEYRSTMKPKPILQDVEISFGGDWGLARKITANIKCFDIDSFQVVQKYFLLPGNTISARFGYSISSTQQWNPEDGEHNLTGFRVATFSFSAGDDGTWIGSFTAVSAAEAIKAIDMAQMINPDENITYKIAGANDAEETANAYSISEIIESDAQRNGSQKMNDITPNTSGYLIGKFQDYAPNKDEVVAGMVVYTGDHLIKPESGIDWGGLLFVASLGKFGGWGKRMSLNSSNHQIYVTLGYVVDRIVNEQIKKSSDKAMASSKDKDFKTLKIKFSKTFSISSLPPFVESGDPLSVLILGAGAKFKDASSGIYMDFNEIKGTTDAAPLGVDDVKAWDGKELRLDKILLHKDVVLGCLDEATAQESSESESVDPKDSKDTLVNVNDFFTKIFAAIRTCTGGALALRLVIDPEDEEGFTYIVVDQNYAGKKEITCYLFNPIDGDGSTRSCNISSEGGSNEYRTYMFLANSKKGDVAANLRDCKDELKNVRLSKLATAANRITELKYTPGKIMKDKFDDKQIDAFKSVMTDFYRYAPESHNSIENINWPGMSIDLTINGAYGIIPGCAVATTQMPSSWYTDKKIYFMVREVVHRFEESDWTTNIQGIMAIYPKIAVTAAGGGGPTEIPPAEPSKPPRDRA